MNVWILTDSAEPQIEAAGVWMAVRRCPMCDPLQQWCIGSFGVLLWTQVGCRSGSQQKCVDVQQESNANAIQENVEALERH